MIEHLVRRIQKISCFEANPKIFAAAKFPYVMGTICPTIKKRRPHNFLFAGKSKSANFMRRTQLTRAMASLSISIYPAERTFSCGARPAFYAARGAQLVPKNDKSCDLIRDYGATNLNSASNFCRTLGKVRRQLPS